MRAEAGSILHCLGEIAQLSHRIEVVQQRLDVSRVGDDVRQLVLERPRIHLHQLAIERYQVGISPAFTQPFVVFLLHLRLEISPQAGDSIVERDVALDALRLDESRSLIAEDVLGTELRRQRCAGPQPASRSADDFGQ